MSKDSEPQQDQTGGLPASLLDAESRGGPTAIKGFDFQQRYALILLLESLPDPGWTAVLVEGAEDVEIRFARQDRVERRAIQLKNYRVTAAKAREIVAHLKKLDDDSPGTWIEFVIACAELDDTLKTIHDGLERYRPSGRFYAADDAILANTRADLARQIDAAKLPVDFLLERVTFQPGLEWVKDEDLVRARALDLLHKAYAQFDRAAVDGIYLSLKDLVAESTVRPIDRQQVEAIVGAVRAQTAAPADYYPIKLRAPLRKVFDPLLEDRIRVFGGREGALARIAAFVQQPKGGYLVVTAPPGFGKTSLMAKLVSAAPEAYAYHFFTRLYGQDSLTEPFFVKNVVQQMAEWHTHTGELPDDLSELRALYQQFIREPLDKTQILVIDGLDEVTWDLIPYVSGRLPDNLHLILTVRDVSQDWRGQYKLPADQLTHLPLGGLDEDNIAGVLRAAGGAAPALAGDPALLRQIRRVAAYQADETLGADPLYVRLLAEDIAAGRLLAGEIEKRPLGLDDYLKVWWEQVRAMAGDEPARDLFGTLTVALGPVPRADLEAINPSLVDDWSADRFDQVLGQVRRFVTGDDRHGYAMAHPRLQEYMRAHIKTAAYRDRLLAYCARWQEHRSRYALTHYAEHLAGAGRNDNLYNLVGKPWMEAKLALFQSHHRFKGDVSLAIDAALAESPVRWDQLVRGCLISASLRSMVAQVPPEVLGVLAQAGDPDRLAQARGYAALITDKRQQADAYRLIGEALAGQGRADEAKDLLRQARVVAESIGDIESRASALNGVAQALAQAGDKGAATQVAQQALAPLEAFRDIESYGQALKGSVDALAQAGDKEALRQALAAQALMDEEHRARAIGWVARALAQVGDREGLGQALAAAGKIGAEEHRARALGWLAHALADVGDQETALRVARQSLAAAEKIGQEEAMARALGRLTQPLVRLGDKQGLRLVLDAAGRLGDKWCATRALGWVATALVEAGDSESALPVARQALAAAKAVRAKKDKPRALRSVAPLLAQVGDKESLERLLAEKAIGDDADRAVVLRLIAQALAQAGDRSAAIQAAHQALSAAEAIADQDTKADLLGEAAQTLAQVGDADGLRQALAAAGAIEGNLSMAWTLSEVAGTLAQAGDRAGLEQLLVIAEAIGDQADKAAALSGIAQALAHAGDKEAAAQAARQAAATAGAFGDEPYKARAFGALALALAQAGDGEGAAQAARQALLAAEAIRDDEYRADALSALVPALAQAGDREGLRAAQQALAAAEATEESVFRPLQLSKAALALAQAGDKAAAARAARRALAAEKDDEMGLELDWVARALAQVGDLDGLGQALELAEAIVDESYRAMALSGLAETLAQVGDVDALGHAVKIAEAIEDLQLKAQALAGVALALALAGDTQAAAQAARQALAAAIETTGEENNAQALTEASQALAQAGDKTAAVQAAQQALVAAGAILDEDCRAQALSRVARALFQAGDGGAAVQAAQQALDAVQDGIAQEMMRHTGIEDGGDKPGLLRQALDTLAQAGDKEGLQRALAVAEEIGGTADKADALAQVARALAQVGDIATAVEIGQRALATAETLLDKQDKASTLSRLAVALAHIGWPDRALPAFAGAFDSSASVGRESVFSVLEQASPTLAGIDAGRTLRRVYDQLVAVEAWWAG
jgi:tetratricopeptide (TPR) repeat protein